MAMGHFTNKRHVPAGHRHLGIEKLETRDLLAVTAFFDSITGNLSIIGDDDPELIEVTVNSVSQVEITGVSGIINGPVLASDVRRIFVNPSLENDTVDLRGVSRSAGFTALEEIEVGTNDGNDLIYGASDIAGVTQVLQGGEGNDTIYGGDNADSIYGGGISGSDYLGDPLGNDYLDGQAGDDLIVGDDTDEIDGANDTIIGGAGNDSLRGGPANDLYLFAENWGKDSITDPAGIDTISFQAATIGIQFNSNVDAPADAPDLLDFDTDQIENYVGGAGDDTFKFGPGASFGNGQGFLDGGAGDNALDYTDFGDGATVNFAEGTATGISSFINIQQAINANVLGTPTTSTAEVSTTDAGSSRIVANAMSADGPEDSTPFLEIDETRSHDGHETQGGGSTAAPIVPKTEEESATTASVETKLTSEEDPALNQ